MSPKQKYDERKRLRNERLLREEQAYLSNYEREQAMDRRVLRFLIAAERIADVMELWADLQERDRLVKANAELEPLLQNIGDGIVNMFDQLVKGNWRDDHDHDVKMNVHMLNLQDVLKQIMRFRADYLDYSEPNFDKHKATSTEREGE